MIPGTDNVAAGFTAGLPPSLSAVDRAASVTRTRVSRSG
jgi:hypothetical protein